MNDDIKEKKIMYVVPELDTEGPSSGRDDMHNNWPDLMDAMRDMTEKMRHECPDSYGRPMLFNWFLLDWVGYDADDAVFKAREQDVGFHHIFDKYRVGITSESVLKESGDGLYWHYHHPPKSGAWGWNRNWSDSLWYEKVLNKKILERDFFPSVFRAGGYVQDNDASAWLERWIPFDYSNNAPAFKKDAYDWQHAPRAWTPYHPSKDDYQSEGDMNRVVARSLPVCAKGGSNTLTEKDVREAFECAKRGERPILSFSTHDYYKSASEEFKTAYALIKKVEKEYPDVAWVYENARDALRKSMALAPCAPLTLSVKMAIKASVTKKGVEEFIINSNYAIFGEMPYVVFEYDDGENERVDVQKLTETKWRFSCDTAKVKKIGVAVNDTYANTALTTLEI